MSKKLLVTILALLLLSPYVYPAVSDTSAPRSSDTQSSSKLSEALIDKIGTTAGDTPILIEAYSQPYDSIIEAVVGVGGRVTIQYKYAPGLAATVPNDKIELVAENLNVKRISLDKIIGLPEDSLQGEEALATLYDEEHSTLIAAQAGDLDVDLDVDISDAFQVLNAYGTTSTNPTYNQGADIDRDGDVDLDDTAVLAALYDGNSDVEPSNYVNSAISGVTGSMLTSSGSGEDTIVAIIDTGINTGHILLNRPGMVVGGVDLSCDDPVQFPLLGFCTPPRTGLPGFDRITNHFHGSFVASVAAGSGTAARAATSSLVRAIEFYTGQTLTQVGPNKLIPLSGIAPQAQLYIVKVFDHTGLGISESLVIQSMEHVISKKLGGLDIDVVNMSLGGANLFDGRDLEDRVVDAATAAGLTMVVAAGNEGPAPNTVASPGTANTAVTVGAAVHPAHIRVFRDSQHVPTGGTLGIGAQLHKNEVQIASFSSRGPTSDCRGKPDLVAAGTTLLAAFAEGSNTGLALASGTSFSTPGVAGVIALLNSHAEKNGLSTTPFDYKQAVTSSADPITGFSVEDQGAGFVDAAGALTALTSDPVLGDSQAPLSENGEICAPRPLVPGSNPGQSEASFTFPGVTLAPSREVNFVFEIHDMDLITVQVSNVNLGANNPLGVNSLEVYLKNSRRSSSLSDYHVFGGNTFGDAAITITDDATTVTGAVMLPPCIGAVTVPPCSSGRQIDAITTRSIVIQPGFYKVTIQNDFTSGDTISADITVGYSKAAKPAPDIEIKGNLKEGQFTGFIPISVPAGATKAVIELSWPHDWSVYPTSDLDLFIVNGTKLNVRGATLNSPERVVINNPASDLAVAVQAFGIPQGSLGSANSPFRLTIVFS